MGLTKLNPTKEILLGKHPENVKRSPKWDGVRKQHLKSNPKCEVCGGKIRINVHHIKPFHTHPELELEPTNLITLCESLSYGLNCHLLIGHLGNYKNVNPKSVEDSKIWNSKLKERNFEVK